MKNSSSAKETILKKIRQALANPVPVPFQSKEGSSSLFKPSVQELELEFAENFTGLKGRFSFCLNFNELADQLNGIFSAYSIKSVVCKEEGLLKLLLKSGVKALFTDDLATAEVSVTSCELLIARTGSIILSSAQPNGRTASIYPPIHICIAFTSQLVYDLREGIQMLKEKYNTKLPSFITLATGPSRTADIEKTLVIGVHGPQEVFVLLLEG